ncbi:MAG: hypothetical protein F4X93_04730 [Proteobacteria bacterium]|nr:hypothetical protein [Pseudomonadota bacterium]MYB89248.1 hypothetical protein [Pseudomonadota bacterium]
MNRFAIQVRGLLALGCIVLISSCAAFLLNGHLSHGYYISPDKTFRCKLPGGALSRQLHIWDQRSASGATVTFMLGSRLLWRVDHLHLSRLKLKDLDKDKERRVQLERGKEHYFRYYLLPNLGPAEIKWERYERAGETEVLIAHTYLKSDGMEGIRELLFSVDGVYLNVLHHAQGISENLENIIPGSLALYKGCEFE